MLGCWVEVKAAGFSKRLRLHPHGASVAHRSEKRGDDELVRVAMVKLEKEKVVMRPSLERHISTLRGGLENKEKLREEKLAEISSTLTKIIKAAEKFNITQDDIFALFKEIEETTNE